MVMGGALKRYGYVTSGVFHVPVIERKKQEEDTQSGDRYDLIRFGKRALTIQCPFPHPLIILKNNSCIDPR